MSALLVIDGYYLKQVEKRLNAHIDMGFLVNFLEQQIGARFYGQQCKLGFRNRLP